MEHALKKSLLQVSSGNQTPPSEGHKESTEDLTPLHVVTVEKISHLQGDGSSPDSTHTAITTNWLTIDSIGNLHGFPPETPSELEYFGEETLDTPMDPSVGLYAFPPETPSEIAYFEEEETIDSPGDEEEFAMDPPVSLHQFRAEVPGNIAYLREETVETPEVEEVSCTSHEHERVENIAGGGGSRVEARSPPGRLDQDTRGGADVKKILWWLRGLRGLFFVIASGIVLMFTVGPSPGVINTLLKIPQEDVVDQAADNVARLLEACQACGAGRLHFLYPTELSDDLLIPGEFLVAPVGQDLPDCSKMVSTWMENGETGVPPWARTIAWVPEVGGLRIGKGCDPTGPAHGDVVVSFEIPPPPLSKPQSKRSKLKNPFGSKLRDWGSRWKKLNPFHCKDGEVAEANDLPFAAVKRGRLVLGKSSSKFLRSSHHLWRLWDLVWSSRDEREARLEVTSAETVRVVTPAGKTLWESPKPDSSL